MRKVLYFLTALLTFSVGSQAQSYLCVTQTNGVQVLGGITVTVTRSSPPPNQGNYCGVGPYQIGKLYADGYNYAFSSGITHIRTRMVRFHDDDSVSFWINGVQQDLTSSLVTLNAFAGSCNQTSTNVGPAGQFYLTTTGNKTGPGEGVEVIIQAAPFTKITSCSVSHVRQNPLASDVYYDFCFADDSCALGFKATVNEPTCTDKDMLFDATDFPNTTYTWTGPSAATFVPSPNVRNPSVLQPKATFSGPYIVTAKRGACTYRDTINVNILPSPKIDTFEQLGPRCYDQIDSILLKGVSLPVGGWVHWYGPGGVFLDSFDQFYDLPINPITSASAGKYMVFARGLDGCTSDTLYPVLNVFPPVFAKFGVEVLPGCLQDTLIVKDSSTGNNTRLWDFDDNGATGTQTIDTHYYQVPKPDKNARNYNVQLIVSNGKCYDTVVAPVLIDHPLFVEFTNDIDSLCQGTEVSFTNNSYATAGTTPTYIWYFGDGDTSMKYDTKHIFNLQGIYQVKLEVEDFLKCVDSYKVEIVVDSMGGIFFNPSDTFICVGKEILFQGKYSTAGYKSAVWDFKDGIKIPDSNQVKHSYDQPGTYTVQFYADYRICPDTFYEKDIIVGEYPVVDLGDDKSICLGGDPVFLQDQVSANSTKPIKWSWNTKTKDITRGIYVRHPGTYAVTADLNGCATTDSVEVKKDCYIDIPNVFTPNGDGVGDYFLPRQLLSRNLSKFKMTIFNRWGEVIFEGNSLNGRGWDGTYGGEPQPQGVYIYLIDVTFGNGATERYQGNVTLLR